MKKMLVLCALTLCINVLFGQKVKLIDSFHSTMVPSTGKEENIDVSYSTQLKDKYGLVFSAVKLSDPETGLCVFSTETDGSIQSVELSLHESFPYYLEDAHKKYKIEVYYDNYHRNKKNPNAGDVSILVKVFTEYQAEENNKSSKFVLKESGFFGPQTSNRKKVILYSNSSGKNAILFKTDLRVNTDGIPTSYHPQDLRGSTIALNSILNGASIYRIKDNIRINNPKTPNKFTEKERMALRKEAYSTFEKFRDSDYEIIPAGYKINWQNVLIADKDGKPCVIKSGKYTGYFASATALKNNLQTNKGECDINNQVNPLEIPTLVLAGGNHIVKKYGARLGDLVVAYNLLNHQIVYGVIGDAGPPDNLGEGSVAMNMKLLDVDKYPKNIKETYKLSTSSNIIIAVLPGSDSFHVKRPYTAENIKNRVLSWFGEAGYDNEGEIMNLFESCKTEFR